MDLGLCGKTRHVEQVIRIFVDFQEGAGEGRGSLVFCLPVGLALPVSKVWPRMEPCGHQQLRIAEHGSCGGHAAGGGAECDWHCVPCGDQQGLVAKVAGRWKDEEKEAQNLCFSTQAQERQDGGGDQGLLQSEKGENSMAEEWIRNEVCPRGFLENKSGLRTPRSSQDAFLPSLVEVAMYQQAVPPGPALPDCSEKSPPQATSVLSHTLSHKLWGTYTKNI